MSWDAVYIIFIDSFHKFLNVKSSLSWETKHLSTGSSIVLRFHRYLIGCYLVIEEKYNKPIKNDSYWDPRMFLNKHRNFKKIKYYTAGSDLSDETARIPYAWN